MAQYWVMTKPKDRRAAQAHFIGDGLNPAAALLGLFWAFYNGMWIVSALLIAVLLCASAFSPTWGLVINITVGVSLLFFGSDLKRWSLQRRGYIEAAHVWGQSRAEAEMRFYADYEPPEAVLPQPKARLAGLAAGSRNW